MEREPTQTTGIAICNGQTTCIANKIIITFFIELCTV